MTHSVGVAELSAVRQPIENPNCMNRLMQWFRDDEVSTILKVSAVVLAVFALVGIGLLVADPIVALLVTVLPAALFGLWALREHCVLNRSEVQTMPDEEPNNQSMTALIASTSEPQTIMPPREVVVQPTIPLEIHPAPDATAPMREQMTWAVGGTAHFNQLPELVLDDYNNNREIPDKIIPEHLSASIMRGMISHSQRPFISLKLKDSLPGNEDIFVLTLFQRYPDSVSTEAWCRTKKGLFVMCPFNTELHLSDWKIIHQIVVERNHPRFTLV